MCNLVDKHEFTHGPQNYRIEWNQTGDNPATYDLLLREITPGSEPETVFTMALTGRSAHAFTENRKFRAGVAKEVELAVMAGEIA